MRTYRGGHRSNLAAPDVNVATTADASVVVIRRSAPGSARAPRAARGAAGGLQHLPAPRAAPAAARGLRRLTPGLVFNFEIII